MYQPKIFFIQFDNIDAVLYMSLNYREGRYNKYSSFVLFNDPDTYLYDFEYDTFSSKEIDLIRAKIGSLIDDYDFKNSLSQSEKISIWYIQDINRSS